MPYSGSGKNPYRMTIATTGTANPTAQSENVPVVNDSVTTYSLSVTENFESIFYDAYVSSLNPAGYWKLADAAGSATAADSSSAGNTATAANTTFGQPGVADSNTSASFNGTTSQVSAAYKPSGISAFSGSVWINQNGQTPGSFPAIVGNSHSSADHNGFLLWIQGGAANIAIGNGTTFGGVVGGAIPATGWVHLAWTWNGTTLTLYVNGVSVGTPASISGPMTAGNAGATQIGYSSTYGGSTFNALIGEVALFQTALTATQIGLLAAPPSYDVGVSSLAPTAWWKLADAAGSATAIDSSGGGNAGTPTAVTYGQSSIIDANTAAAFNGTTSKITTSYNPSALAAFSVSAWVNLNGVSAVGHSPRIVANSSGVLGFALGTNTAQAPFFIVSNGTSNFLVTGPTALPTTGWVHLAGTWDGVNTRLYVNGVNVTSVAGGSGTMAAGPQGIAIGKNPDSADFFNGLIAEVATFSRTLSAAQVTMLAAATVTASLKFYNASNAQVGSTVSTLVQATSSSTLGSAATTPTVAPATATYCVGSVAVTTLTPSAAQVCQAAVNTASNTAQPAVANTNYTFIYGTDPWTAVNSAVLGWEFDPLLAADGDFDSLVIDGVIELMGGTPGVQSTIPELVDPATGRGVIFRIPYTGGNVAIGTGGAAGPYDLGAPQPTTDAVQSLLLDGEMPFGYRASNRTISIPVLIFAPSLNTLAAARELLLKTIDQQTWKMTWRPASSGLPMELDCFRAQPSVITYGVQNNAEAANSPWYANWAKSLVTLTIPALPYAHSGQDGTKLAAFLNGTLDGGSYVPSVQVDNFSSVSGTGWSLNTAFSFGSSQSARYQAPVPMKMPWAAATYGKSGLNLNLTGLPSLTLWFGQSYDTQWPLLNTFVSNVTLSWTLTDANNHKLTFSGKQNKAPWGANPNKPAWTRITSTIPQGKTKPQFDYSKVTAYSVKITNWSGSGTSGYVRMHAWLSQISANARTALWVNTPHGYVYSIFGDSAMARSPINVEVQLPALNPTTREFTASNAFTVDRGVTSVFAEGFGGGGGGGSVAAATGGIGAAGGGGGEYAADTISVIPGTLVPFTIGQGGSGGQVVAASNTFGHPGPNTWTCPSSVTTITCFLWGGGAAGGAGAGGGGGGAYTEGTVNVTPGKTYTFTVGASGRPNTGKLSKDQAARHGGDTVVRGDTGSLHAKGGSSPVTGGTTGGAGAPRWTTVEAGTTVTYSANGGNGGNSPGAAGGGGGASGNNTANGLRGGDSPKGSNNYGTGGPGAAAAGNGGAGGKGANLSGVPVQGVIPGGGGGGGYTRTVNYTGAYGANGKIIINYQVNAGSPVNGTATTFGAAGLTNKILTAHGGSSPAINATAGAAGGTGSANTVHFNGGVGSKSGNNSDYLFRANDTGGPFTSLATVAGTAATVTTGTSSTAQTTGVVIASVLSTTALNAQVTVSDSAGNVYDFVSSVLVSGTVWLSVYAAKIGNPITTSTQLTLNNNSVSVNALVQWLGSVQYQDIDFATVLTNSATSTAPGVPAIANADIGIHKGYLVIAGNNSTAVVSVAPADPASWATSAQATSEATSGTATIDAMIKEIPGSGASAAGFVATYGSSVAWGAISVPLIPQDTNDPTLLKVGKAAGTGTTSAVAFTNAFAIPANRGYMLLLCHFAGTPGTISFTDATGNTWSQLSTVTIGTSVFRAYTAKATTAYATTNTVTLNDTTSQQHSTTLYYVHEAQGIDASLTKTATGTSAAPSITTNAGASYDDLHVVVYANNNTVDTTSTPAGWVSWQNVANGAQEYHAYAKRGYGRTTYTPTSSYAGSQTWGAMAFGFTNAILSGSGGAAGGPLGTGQDGTDNGGSAWSGGGKGANGLTGSVGSGTAAAVPGGGGSGAASTDTSSFQGGSGGAGMLRLTWQPPLTTFNDFILHRPGPQAKQTLCPIVTIPPNDPPDNREYAVPSLVTGRNAEFWGTYTVMVVANAWNPATTGVSRRISVTVNQYAYTNGPACSVQATRVVTPATDIVNGYVTMGEVTLPIKDYDEANDQVYYTVSIHGTDQGDSFQDMLFLDTSGQTALLNIAPGTASDGEFSSFYVNEPSFDRALGGIFGSQQGREVSISCLDMAMLTGGPLYIDAGENLLLAYSTGGAPNLGVRFDLRWFSDRPRQ